MENREGWLTEVARRMEPLFSGWALAPYRITCGWPCRGGLAVGKRVLGECHALEASGGKVHEIFISPTMDDPVQVAGVSCHELAHVAAGVKAGHGPRFVKVCRHVGLNRDRPTSAAPDDRLTETIMRIVEAVGPYPHIAVSPVLKRSKSTTQVSLRCPSCACTVRISPSWVKRSGRPVCGCGVPFVPKEGSV